MFVLMISFSSQEPPILLFLAFFNTIPLGSSIEGPTYIECYTEETALFRYNTTDQGGILYARWGIRTGDSAKPWFINVSGYNNTVNIKADLDESLRERVDFVGDLKKGHAWFALRNLIVNDTNKYIISISVNGTELLPYYMRLNVTEKKETPTTGYNKSSNGPDRTNTLSSGHNKTSILGEKTKPNSSTADRARHINDLLIPMAIALQVLYGVAFLNLDSCFGVL